MKEFCINKLDERGFKTLHGVSKSEYKLILAAFEEVLVAQRLEKPCKRALGGGRRGMLGSS